MQRRLEIKNIRNCLKLVLLISFINLSGCSSSGNKNEDEEVVKETEIYNPNESDSENNVKSEIISYAALEQQNPMYSPECDTSYLYWLDSLLLLTDNSTKCNIFALNVLHKSGYKTPDVNTLCADLFDTTFASGILPVTGINDYENTQSGDLIIWEYHVIIFESIVELNGEVYANGWWAGTRNSDNGVNIINNVCHGNYPLSGDYIIRRPMKK